MGIQGLLPFVKEATQPVNIRKYSGYAVAVDTYCWLHKGAFACSLQLAKGEPTDMYVRYCLKYVNMLRSMGVRPILVFDGCTLPAKKHVEQSRREKRELYNKKGRQFLREGKVSEARDCFNKCVNVTPQMALNVMKAARSLGVDCIVAPYEADAQLAYLHKVGIAQAVITEDSDLIAFGCKRVIVKLDLNGNGLEIESSKLHQAMKIGAKFTPEKFRFMCIVSGCDYLPSLPGIGLGKARKLFQLVTNPNISEVLKRMPGTLKLKQSVPEEYIDGFHKANNTFLHQLAFDPRKKKLVPLNPYPEGLDPKDMEYAGKYLNDEQAYHIALGNMDINTMQKIFNFTPDRTKSYDRTLPRHKLSIWHRDYRIGPDITEENLKEVERQGTRGKEVMLKVKSCKRPREEELPEELPTDNELASMYGTPAAKRKPSPPPDVIPETPSPCKTKSSQQLAADKLLEKAKSPKRSPLRRFNRFAVKGRNSERRALHLKDDKITSRFFGPPPEETESNENDLQTKTSQENHSLQEDGICKIETSDDEEAPNDARLVKREWAWGQAEPATSRSTTLSALDKLQKFHRSNSAPVLVSRTKDGDDQSEVPSQETNLEMSRDLDVKQKEILEMMKEVVNNGAAKQETKQGDECKLPETKKSNSLLSNQSGRTTPKGRSVFSWRSSKSVKSNKVKTSSTLSLDMFRRASSGDDKAKMNWKREPSSEGDKQKNTPSSPADVQKGIFVKHNSNQYSQNSEISDKLSQEDVISQESESQLSFDAKMSQSSDLYSLDAEAMSYSQLGISRHNSLFNSQETFENQSQDLSEQNSSEDLPGDIQNQASLEVDHINSTAEVNQNQCLPKLPSIQGIEVDIPSSSNLQDANPEMSRDLFSNTKKSKLTSFYMATEEKPDKAVSTYSSKDAKTKEAILDSISSYFGGAKSKESEGDSPEKVNSKDASDSISSTDDTECIDLTDCGEMDSATELNNSKQKQSQTKSLQNSSLKKIPAASKLQGACKPSGLSKKRKRSNSKKTDENAPRQTTLFSFMKKAQPKNESERKTHTSDGPMSPVKTNIIQDETPEGDNGLVKKDIKKVQRVIFS